MKKAREFLIRVLVAPSKQLYMTVDGEIPEEGQLLVREVLDPCPKDEAIKILKEALRWYADGMHWNDNYANEGSCAKMALAAVEKLEKE